MEKVSAYWDSYYRERNVPTFPSQFAVFALSQAPDVRTVIEFGCGNGRDAFFFVRQGMRVIGIDRSAEAISQCSNACLGKNGSAFFKADVGDPGYEAFWEAFDTIPRGRILVYCRFFIHAINDREEGAFLKLVFDILSKREGVFMAEFRTQKDRDQNKIAPDHYRRFRDPIAFSLAAAKAGLHCDYFVEGFGMANYKQEDAHVARLILRA
jgi:SAM-dependent methyltransferase